MKRGNTEDGIYIITYLTVNLKKIALLCSLSIEMRYGRQYRRDETNDNDCVYRFGL